MIPTHRELHPSIHEALGTGRFEGRRGHRHAGSLSTALYPLQAGMYRFKGGGGIGGLIVGIVAGAVLGAVTGGIGFAAFGLGGTFASASLGIAAGTMMSSVVGGAIMGAIGGALSGALGMVIGGQKPDEASQAAYQARDNKLTVRNSVGPRKKIYGTALAGGLMVYATSTGSTHEYFHSVNAIATHQVQAIRETFFNNLTATNSRFNGFYRINKHLGTQTQAADADLVSESGGEWTSAHRLRESAYIYPRIKYDTNAWVSGLPSTTVMVDGALYYDPRAPHLTLSASAAGSPGVFSTVGAHGFAVGDIVFLRNHTGATYAGTNGLSKPVAKRYAVNTVPSSSTFTLLNDSGEPMALLTGGAGGSVAKCAWSNNAALAVLDYITSRDGINCKTSEVDWPYWEDAADVCDEDVSLGTSQTFTASASSNALTLANEVGWQTGIQVFVSSSGSPPAPLVAGTTYYWIKEDGSSGRLATSYDNAVAGTAVDLADAGSGTHTVQASLRVTVSASDDSVTLPNLSSYIETGDCVTLHDTPMAVTLYNAEVTTVLQFPGTYPDYDVKSKTLGWYSISTGEFLAEPGPYTITRTVAELQISAVTGSPSTNQFIYNAGTYTFSASDVGRNVKIGNGSVQAIPESRSITVEDHPAPQDYYWINTDYLTGKLATSRANAMAGTAADLVVSGSTRLTRKAQARYTVNGIIDLSKKPIDILNELLTACGGVMVYTQGKYRLFPAAPAASVKTISQKDLRGPIKILPHTSRMQLINAIRGTYKEPAKYWEMTDFPPLTDSSYEEEDGGVRLYKDVAYPHTIDSQRAQRLGSIALGRARRGMVVNFPATVKQLGISAWDCISLDSTLAGLAGKKFRVVYWALAENGQGIDLTLNEEDDAIYEWEAGNGAVVAQNDLSSLPSPWEVPPPTGLALSSGTDDLLVQGDGSVLSRIKATWTDPPDASIVRIEVHAKPSASTTWQQFAPVLPGTGVSYISPVTDGDPWDVRLRAVNAHGAKSDSDGSEWQATVTGHKVVGKTAPPSDPANLYVTNGNVVWEQPVQDKDLAGWRVRHLSGRSRNWSQGANYPADGSVVTAPSIPTTAFGSGIQTIMVRSVDTSGNLSTGTLYLTLGLGEQSPANLILTYDEAAAGFPGTITGGSVVGGSLVADSSGDLYLPDSNALYLPVIGSTYLPGAWAQMAYEFSYVPAYADAPATLLLAQAIAADGWQVQYRRRGAGLYLQYDDDAYLPDDGLYLGGVQPYTAWPGAVAYNARETLDFRIVCEAGSRRGTIYTLAVKVDVPDVTESFQDLAIAPGGTRIPLTKTYRVIDYIGQITVQDSGTGAAYPVVIDKNPILGPLIEVRNSSGVSVAASIDIRNLKGH